MQPCHLNRNRYVVANCVNFISKLPIKFQVDGLLLRVPISACYCEAGSYCTVVG